MNTNPVILVPIHDPAAAADVGGGLRPLVAGAALLDAIPDYLPAVLRDDQGDSISDRYATHGLLTALYWIWRNPGSYGDPDAVGILPPGQEFARPGTSGGASLSWLRGALEEHPAVAATPLGTPGGRSARDAYALEDHRHVEDLDTCLDVIAADFPDMREAAEEYSRGALRYREDALVMRRDTFDAYCAFLSHVLGMRRRLTDDRYYTRRERPVPRFLHPYLTGVFLTHLSRGDAAPLLLGLRDAKRPLDTVPARIARRRDARRQEPPAPEPRPAIVMRLEHATLGDHNAYALVTLEGTEGHPLRPGTRVHAAARDAAGNDTPARIIDTPAGPVLITPLSPFPKTVTLTAWEGDKEVASRDVPCTREGIGRLAEENRDDPIAQGIAASDGGFVVGDLHIYVDAVIEDNPHGADILHGRIAIPLAGGHRRDDHIEVSALSPDATPYDLGAWVVMGDRVQESPIVEGLQIRTVSFSVKTPKDEPFILWAHFPETPAEDGFAYYDREAVADLAARWDDHTHPAYADMRYDTWFQLVHRARPEELALQRASRLPHEPLFSIVVPVYRTPLEYFTPMVDSVLAQSYANWELLLVDASPDDEELERKIGEYCAQDGRIRKVEIESNEGITLNTNAGIAAARGDFVCFLDHDDFLEGDALYRYARAVNRHDDIDLLYCDEDKYECDGQFLEHPIYREPAFKPDWNPDLLLAENYVGHFLVVRKSLLDTLPAPGAEFDGSQDWNMTWRAGEKARRIHHEARVLYHWRSHHNSTASSRSQKNYALEAGRLAVQQHLDRAGVRGTPETSRRAGEGYFHVAYHWDGDPLVSIIIPNKDAVPVLHRCVSTVLRRTTWRNYEIVIVENNSTDQATFDYYEWVARLDPRIRVVEDTDVVGFNFSQIVNFGAAHSTGEEIALLNNDVSCSTPDWIEQMIGPLRARRDVGAVGAELLYPDDTIQHAGVTLAVDGPAHLYQYMPFTYNGNFQSAVLDRDMPALTGACLMTSRAAWDAVGGFDEDLPENYNDIDYCLKLGEKGLLVVYNPEVVMHHAESLTRGISVTGPKERAFRRDRGHFMERWPQAYMRQIAPGININFAYGAYDTLDMAQQHPTLW